MIIVGGLNIYPAEIEGALVQHEAVGDVAVFGIPNADTGEEIKAVVELRDGWEPSDETTEAIMSWLRQQIARQKLPRTIDYTTEMPRDPNGKLYKRRCVIPTGKAKKPFSGRLGCSFGPATGASGRICVSVATPAAHVALG